MNYDLGKLCFRIHWMLAKSTLPGWEDIRQTTTVHTLYWIQEGRGLFRTDHVFPVEAGTLLYMHPGLELQMKTDPKEPLQMLMLLFDCAEAGYRGGEWEELQRVGRLRLPFTRQYAPDQAVMMTKQLLELLRSWVPGMPGSEIYAKAGLLKLMADLHGSMPVYSTEAQDDSESSLHAFRLIKQNIELFYASDMTVKALCSSFGLSESYARVLFKQHIGMGPKEYLEQIRNGHARRHLIYSKAPLKDIAILCGYADEYHFSKVFRRLNGMPPSEYRNRKRTGSP
jgi:AraC family transcriptional regulator